MNVALYPGTFDPVTLGHIDLVERALRLFDRLVVAVAASEAKGPLFSQEKRIELFSEAVRSLDGVTVVGFDSLTVQFARSQGAGTIVRGLRAISDFEYEFQLALMNRKLDPEVETVFLCPNEKFSYLNSTLVKEVARLGGDPTGFVPETVARALSQRFAG